MAWPLFLIVFAVYAFMAYPTVAPRDSADLACAALTLTPAHPPGYPLYVLLGKVWMRLIPWGDPAYRLNLLSAAAGAGCVAAVFLLLSASVETLPALAAALALAFSAPLWKFSLLCEMYSGQGFLLALVLGCAATRQAALGAFLLGLALANHQAFFFALPGLAVLWWPDRHRLRACWPYLLLGLSPYLFLWVSTGDLSRAWAVATRQEYGTWQLSSGLSRPFGLGLSLRLLGYFCQELWRRVSPLALGLALVGASSLWRHRRRQAAGWLAVLAGLGPAFLLAARFDPGNWVARTVLESAFVGPAVMVCLLAGFGLDWCARRWPAWGLPLAAVLAGASLWQNAAGCFHRDDFSAYDYARDLRRALPPGSTALAGGDTALFAARYLDLAHPDGQVRRLVAWQDAAKGLRPDFTLGVSLDNLARIGLRAEALSPEGLVQRVGRAASLLPWEFSVLRRGRALRLQESYARDILLAYAFAHYLSGTLQEARRPQAAQWEYLEAAALDPEDYQIRYK